MFADGIFEWNGGERGVVPFNTSYHFLGTTHLKNEPLIELMIKLILFPDYCHPFIFEPSYVTRLSPPDSMVA